MTRLLIAASLVTTGFVSVYTQSGDRKGYETLIGIYEAGQPAAPVPALPAALTEPPPPATAPGSAVPGCPGIDDIKAGWVEHTDPAEIPVYVKDRLNSAVVQSGPLLLSIHRVPYYVGVVRRGDLIAQADLELGCRVTGTAAYYVIGEEGAPEVDFDLIMANSDQEKILAGRLAELRWFDLNDGQRHRWYNLNLAASLGWLADEYGRPTPDYRPTGTFTGAANELY